MTKRAGVPRGGFGEDEQRQAGRHTFRACHIEMNYKVEEEYGTYEKGLETVQRTNW